jgi:hypothetical protein
MATPIDVIEEHVEYATGNVVGNSESIKVYSFHSKYRDASPHV